MSAHPAQAVAANAIMAVRMGVVLVISLRECTLQDTVSDAAEMVFSLFENSIQKFRAKHLLRITGFADGKIVAKREIRRQP